MRIFNSKENPENAAELEREAQAKEMVQSLIVFDADRRKPGAWIERWGKKFSRISELKAKHFNHPKLGGS
jgi:hypothetical protein